MTEASPPAYEDRFYSPVASGLFGFDSSKRPIGITIGANLTLVGTTLVASGSTGTATWGMIGGTLSNQTDLQAALNAKLTAASNLSDLTIPGTALTNLGGTTVGVNFFTLTNPSAVTFPQINANNTVSALSASAFRTAIGAGTGAGTVTAISVASANGFAGTSSGGATPALTITTTITGVLKGNGTAISAATAGTDYSAGTSALATGILKSTTTTGALTIGVAAADYVAPSAYASTNGLTIATARLLGRTTAGTGAAEEITVSTGLTLSAGVLTASGSGGTVTSASVVSANGFAGTVATATTTPAITLTTTITGVLQGNGTAISAATTTGSGSVVLATAPTIAGGSITGLTTLAIRDTSAAFDVTLAATSSTTISAGRTLTIDVVNAARTLKLTGNPTLADWFDQSVKTTASPAFVTVTAALTGNATTATTLATPRAIYGNNFDGSAALTQIIASTFGGTGNGFTKFTGPTTSEKTFTLPNASATVLTDNALVTVAQGGIGVGTLASNGVLYGNGTSAVLALAVNSSATNKFLTQSSSGAPAWATIVSGDVPNLGANPSASAGLTAVNGSATTYMRSDGAPAISQSIVPTWTGLHTFGALFTVTGSGNQTVTIASTSGTTNAARCFFQNTAQQWLWGIPSGATDGMYLYDGTNSKTILIIEPSNGLMTLAGSQQINFNGGAVNGANYKETTDTSGANFIGFYNGSNGNIGSVARVTTTNAVAYNTTSDGRLKTNIRDFIDSGRIIDGLRPRLFDWKDHAGRVDHQDVIGFIAQEENAVDPVLARIGAVTIGDNDGLIINRQWQRSDSALVPILCAELKSLRERMRKIEIAAIR